MFLTLGVTTSIPAGVLESQRPSWGLVSGGLHHRLAVSVCAAAYPALL